MSAQVSGRCAANPCTRVHAGHSHRFLLRWRKNRGFDSHSGRPYMAASVQCFCCPVQVKVCDTTRGAGPLVAPQGDMASGTDKWSQALCKYKRSSRHISWASLWLLAKFLSDLVGLFMIIIAALARSHGFPYDSERSSFTISDVCRRSRIQDPEYCLLSQGQKSTTSICLLHVWEPRTVGCAGVYLRHCIRTHGVVTCMKWSSWARQALIHLCHVKLCRQIVPQKRSYLPMYVCNMGAKSACCMIVKFKAKIILYNLVNTHRHVKTSTLDQWLRKLLANSIQWLK
jgi:hypothetical protein